ncbi:MAG: PepSY domain-containing protein [Deltaproteobacteria bacterium]
MNKVLFITLILAFGTYDFVLAEEKPRLTIDDALNIANKEVPGKVLEAEFEDGIYEIKIMTEKGEKIKLKIDPDGGAIIRKGLMMKDRSKNGFEKPQN